MYWNETWASRNAEQDMLERKEMRKLRWMLGKKRNYIRRSTNVEIMRYNINHASRYNIPGCGN